MSTAVKKKLRKEVETAQRDKARQRLKRLRADLRAALAERHLKIRRVRSLCTLAHEAYLISSLERRRKLFAELKAEREQNRSSCRAAVATVDATAEQAVGAARSAFGEERRHQRQQAVWDRKRMLPGSPAPGQALASHRARERAQESSEEVERDLPDELLPVWKVMQHEFHGTERMTRTEAFLHWVHDHSADVYQILEADAARHLARLQHEELQCADGMCVRPYPRDRHDVVYGQDEVPF